MRFRIASQTVSRTLARAYRLQFDSTMVHGASAWWCGATSPQQRRGTGQAFPISPVLVGDLPLLVGHFLSLPKPPQLLVGIDIQPNFSRTVPKCTSCCSIPLISRYASATEAPCRTPPPARPARGRTIPVEDRDVPGLGHLRPETPQVMVSFLDVVGGGDRDHFVPTRIEVLRQPADIPSFAGRIPTLVGDDHRHPPQINLVLQLAKRGLGFLQPGSILLRGQRDGQVDMVERSGLEEVTGRPDRETVTPALPTSAPRSRPLFPMRRSRCRKS